MNEATWINNINASDNPQIYEESNIIIHPNTYGNYEKDYVMILGHKVMRSDKDFYKKLELYDGPTDDLEPLDYNYLLKVRMKEVVDRHDKKRQAIEELDMYPIGKEGVYN